MAEPETTSAISEILAEELEEPGAEELERERALQRASNAFRPTLAGWTARRAALVIVLGVAAASPMLLPLNQVHTVAKALIFIVVGLSINVLMGYMGQISLGHQAFVGVGAFTAAIMVSKAHSPMFVGLVVAGATGGVAAILLGVVALRLKGLYLALITLAYGTIAENSIFNTPSITGGGAGAIAERPTFLKDERAYAYLCMLIVVLVLYIDWRMVRSKVGRAFFAIRDNELAAASFGINVVGFKLTAFVISGVIAGVAGSLFAHWNEVVVAADFNFFLALTFVLMVVVGGLASRPGVVIGSAFFALLPLLLDLLFKTGFMQSFMRVVGHVPVFGSVVSSLPDHTEFVGAALLLLTLTAFPGGIAQQIEPLLRWLRGGQLRGHGKTQEIASGGAGVRP